jgi:hypothetical protein
MPLTVEEKEALTKCATTYRNQQELLGKAHKVLSNLGQIGLASRLAIEIVRLEDIAAAVNAAIILEK